MKTKSVFLIDVGNTSVCMASYSGGRMNQEISVPHHKFPKLSSILCKSGPKNNNIAVICSTVPKLTSKLTLLLNRYNISPVWVAGKNIPVKIKHKYKDYNKLGIDRKVSIYGALRIYRPPFLLLDYGTAITADFVSSKGVFEGGLIIPGPEISFQALLNRAAQIPDHLRLPASRGPFLGRNTYDCIRSGTIEGFSAMTDELIRRFKTRYGKSLRVIASGGFASTLRPHVKGFDVIDPKHLLKSLLILYKDSLNRVT